MPAGTGFPTIPVSCSAEARAATPANRGAASPSTARSARSEFRSSARGPLPTRLTVLTCPTTWAQPTRPAAAEPAAPPDGSTHGFPGSFGDSAGVRGFRGVRGFPGCSGVSAPFGVSANLRCPQWPSRWRRGGTRMPTDGHRGARGGREGSHREAVTTGAAPPEAPAGHGESPCPRLERRREARRQRCPTGPRPNLRDR